MVAIRRNNRLPQRCQQVASIISASVNGALRVLLPCFLFNDEHRSISLDKNNTIDKKEVDMKQACQNEPAGFGE